jgi:hypothetical protein
MVSVKPLNEWRFSPMSFLPDREKAFENKYAHDEEMRFKVLALRTKYLGLWIAEQFSLKDETAEAYAKSLIIADLSEQGDEDLFTQIRKDYAQRNIPLDETILKEKLAFFHAKAGSELL